MTIVLTELQHKSIEEKSSSKLQAFQRKVYLKAKQNPNYKFYCLYDKVFRIDFLQEAYQRVKANKGASGIDKVSFESLKDRETEFILEIQDELKSLTYQPQGLRQVQIPKSNGKMRLLKIPTIKDRVVQMAIKLVIEPIFEADFQDNSYGYRPKTGAHKAIGALSQKLFREIYQPKEKQKTIQSIDLSDCFNTIPQKQLIQLIAKRIIDRQLLKLIKAILAKGAMEESPQDNLTGTPQGGVISPLLANVYLNQADKFWKDRTSNSQFYRYADDMVVLLHSKDEQLYQEYLKYLEQELMLKVNREKSQRESLKTGFDFLGMKLMEKTSRNNKQYLSTEPSLKAQKKLRDSLRAIIFRRNPESTEQIILKANRVLRGWHQYFDNIGMGKVREKINDFAKLRVAKLVSRRNKKIEICWKLFPKGVYEDTGLYKMESLNRKFSF
jgi:group II intron reverse transcriptase/maturase